MNFQEVDESMSFTSNTNIFKRCSKDIFSFPVKLKIGAQKQRVFRRGHAVRDVQLERARAELPQRDPGDLDGKKRSRNRRKDDM